MTKRWMPPAEYCTITNEYENRPKTITEHFAESIKRVQSPQHKQSNKRTTKETRVSNASNKLLKPADGYTPRFQYNGYLKKSHWCYHDETQGELVPETEEQRSYRMRKKQKFCLLMGFAGGNYQGMQYNCDSNTIESNLLKAMLKNGWILGEHVQKHWLFEFSRGSRTDRSVSAARMNVSAVLRKFIQNSNEKGFLPFHKLY